MKKILLSKIGILAIVFVLAPGVTFSFAAPEELEEKRKCKDLIENKEDVSPDLYTEVLNCELDADDETFAAVGGLGGGRTDLASELITGNDLPLTGLGDDGGVGGFTGSGSSGSGTGSSGSGTGSSGSGTGSSGSGTGSSSGGDGCISTPGFPCPS